MEETKRILVDNIQEWLKIDNEMKTLRKEMKVRRERKKLLTALLCDIMKKNQIDDVALKNEKLVYAQTKVKTPLSKKHLFNSLSTFFQDDNETAKKVALFVMNSRKEKINENIKRKNIK